MLDRVKVDPGVCDGRPTIRGLRITVDFVLKLLGDGYPIDRIVREYPELDREEVHQAMRYGATPLETAQPPTSARADSRGKAGAQRTALARQHAAVYSLLVPELSRFFGIIIRMFVEVGGQHHRAHFHAYYQESVGVFSIEPVDLIAGELPTRQRRLVEAWAELHQEELLADWGRLQAGQAPAPIEPLR